MRNVVAVVCVVLAGLAYGQDKPQAVDPDAFRAAQERLQAKAAEKNAARAEMVSISRGELEDLRAEVARLRDELASLKGGNAPAGKPVAAAPKRNPTKIELGMTKEEVERFVKSKLGALRFATSGNSGHALAGSRQETIRIEKVSKAWGKTGTQGSAFGQSRATYGNVEQVDGVIDVTMDNGVVTSVNEH